MSNYNRKILGLFGFIASIDRFMETITDLQKLFTQMHRGPMRVLILLRDHEKLTNSEISDFLQIKPASVSNQVQKLVEKELVEKERDEQDKRITQISLTAKGYQKISSIMDDIDAFANDLVQSLSDDEKKTLMTLLEKMVSDHVDKIPAFTDEELWDEETSLPYLLALKNKMK